MKITAITITKHRLKLDPPFRASWDSRPRVKFDAYIVRVATDAGITGIAGTDTMLAGFPGHEDLFVGWDPLALERHNRILANIQFHYGRCWPIDIALWDIAGKAANMPVWRLLGGAGPRIPAYLSSGTLRDAGAMAELGELTLARGFKAMKIRFHRPDWRDDVKAVAAVRQRVGDRLALMVDCNQGWRMPWDADEPWTLKDALEVAKPLEELDVYWMEEPLHRGDYDGMAALRRRTRLRIAGGEMTREPHEIRTLIDRQCLDVLQPDIVLSGGITGMRGIARQALDHNIAFTPHTWSNGMGVLANVHFAAGVCQSAYVEFPFDPPEWGLDRRDFMMAEKLECDRDGNIVLPDRPGLGAILDEDMLARTRVE
jgi:L-alanine-DL-glutamate epimerase-like enolase superfamily enzyme